MNTWIHLLNESFNKNELSKYLTIYHIGSYSYEDDFENKTISLDDLITIFEKKSIDMRNDTLEIFIAIKEDEISDLILIYNPYEFFENSYIYKVIHNIDEKVKKNVYHQLRTN